MFFKKKRDFSSIELSKKNSLTALPLGESRTSAIVQSKNNGNNTFICSNDLQEITGMILQSVKQGRSVVILDMDNELYKTTYKLFKNSSYHIKFMDAKDDDTNSWSVFGAIKEKEDYMVAANTIVNVMRWQYIEDKYIYNEDFIAGVSMVLAALMSYAVEHCLLLGNKFEFLYNLVNNNGLETLNKFFANASDTSKELWFDYQDEYFDDYINASLILLEILKDEDINKMINDNDLNMKRPSIRKTVYYFNFMEDERKEGIPLNIIANFCIDEFSSYQKYCIENNIEPAPIPITFIVHKVDKQENLEEFFLKTLDTPTMYDICYLYTCNDSRAFYDEYQNIAVDVIKSCPYVIISNHKEIEEQTLKTLLELEKELPEIEEAHKDEIIITNEEIIECSKYQLPHHTLYHELTF